MTKYYVYKQDDKGMTRFILTQKEQKFHYIDECTKVTLRILELNITLLHQNKNGVYIDINATCC